MRRWLGRVAFAAFLVCRAVPTLAAPLTVGYVDAVTGFEWASVSSTQFNVSLNTFAAVCPWSGSACSGVVGTTDLAGWSWASRDLVRDLFVNATDLTAAQLADYFEVHADALSTWAPQLVTNLGFTASSAQQNAAIGAATTGAVGSAWGPRYSDVFVACGGCKDTVNLSDTLLTDGNEVLPSHWGFWVYRQPTAVPEPASLVLLGTGVIGTVVRRYRRKS